MPTFPSRQEAAKDDSHIEETLRSVLRFRAEHIERASLSQRLVGRAADTLGRPLAPIILAGLLALWMGGNFALALSGRTPLDAPPFYDLQCVIAVASLFAVVLVLSAQSHEDQLNSQRDLLSLELALLVERKTTKVIELLEELRRDLPSVHDRHDPAAHSMSTPADTQAVLDSIRQELYPAEGQYPDLAKGGN